MDKKKSELDTEDIELLGRSKEQVGPLYPVLKTKGGVVLSGRHRLAADPTWPTKEIEAKDRKAELLVIINSNIQRRVPKDETKKYVNELAEILAKDEKIRRIDVGSEIVKRKLLPFSERYILGLLRAEYKHIEKATKAAELVQQEDIVDATKTLGELPPEALEATAKKLAAQAKKKAESPEERERRREEEARKQIEKAREDAKKALLTGRGSVQSKIDKAKELGIDTKKLEARAKEIGSKVANEPQEALKEAKTFKQELDTIIRVAKAEQRRKKEEAERAKLKEEVKEEAKQELLEDPEVIEEIKKAPIPQSKKDKAKQAEETVPSNIQAVAENLRQAVRQAGEDMRRPEVQEAHKKLIEKAFVSSVLDARTKIAGVPCPKCGKKDTLRWTCCDVPFIRGNKK